MKIVNIFTTASVFLPVVRARIAYRLQKNYHSSKSSKGSKSSKAVEAFGKSGKGSVSSGELQPPVKPVLNDYGYTGDDAHDTDDNYGVYAPEDYYNHIDDYNYDAQYEDGSQDGATSSPSRKPTKEPTNLPTDMPTDNSAQLFSHSFVESTSTCSRIKMRDFLTGITTIDKLNDVSTPQAKAFSWLLYDDVTEPCPENVAGSPINMELKQRYILAAFYYAMGGDGWVSCSKDDAFCEHNSLLWLSEHHCNWLGIECSISGDYVRSISLPMNNLDGRLADIENELSHLTNFRELILFDNRISGPFPRNLGGKNDSIFRINISNNLFSGVIDPDSFPKNKIISLKVAANNFEGPIEWLAEREGLRQIDLSDNDFTGTITDGFGDLLDLSLLRIERNLAINGTMPTSVCDLREMQPTKLLVLTSSCKDTDIFECSCCTKCY